MVIFFYWLIPCPFFATIVLSKNWLRSPWLFGGFLERRIPGKNGEGTPRILVECLPQTAEGG